MTTGSCPLQLTTRFSVNQGGRTEKGEPFSRHPPTTCSRQGLDSSQALGGSKACILPTALHSPPRPPTIHHPPTIHSSNPFLSTCPQMHLFTYPAAHPSPHLSHPQPHLSTPTPLTYLLSTPQPPTYSPPTHRPPPHIPIHQHLPVSIHLLLILPVIHLFIHIFTTHHPLIPTHPLTTTHSSIFHLPTPICPAIYPQPHLATPPTCLSISLPPIYSPVHLP